MNPYSLGVVLILFVITTSLLVSAHFKDKKDEVAKQYMNSKDYDILQHYIVFYSKERFDNKYSLFKLFGFMVKVKIIQ